MNLCGNNFKKTNCDGPKCFNSWHNYIKDVVDNNSSLTKFAATKDKKEIDGSVPLGDQEGKFYGANIHGAKFLTVHYKPPYYQKDYPVTINPPWYGKPYEATYMNRTKVKNEPPVKTYKNLYFYSIPQYKYEKYEPIINTLTGSELHKDELLYRNESCNKTKNDMIEGFDDTQSNYPIFLKNFSNKPFYIEDAEKLEKKFYLSSTLFKIFVVFVVFFFIYYFLKNY